MEPFLLKEPKLRINLTEMIWNPEVLDHSNYATPTLTSGFKKNMIASTDWDRRRNFQMFLSD
jgi:hypothetical protein